jgi:precorrin-6B methylase 2
MNTFEIQDEEINSNEILEKIRNNIQNRKKSGAYLDSITNLVIENSEKSSCPTANRLTNKDIEYLTSNYEIQNKNYAISSHRPIIGSFLVKARNLVNGEVKRYVDPIFAQQTELNACTSRSSTGLMGKNEELIRKNDEIVGKYEEVAGKYEEVAGKYGELMGKYVELAGKNEELTGKNEELNLKVSELEVKVSKIDKKLQRETSDMSTFSINSLISSPWGEYYSEDISEEDLLGNINHHKHFISLIEEYAQKASGNNVPKLIEVGVGTATMSIYFSRSKYEVLGLDNDINVIFNSLATNKRLGGHANFVMMDANSLNLVRKKYFDVAFSQGTLEHFDNDGIVKILSKQLEAAKYVVFSVPSIHYPKREFGNERKMTTEEWEVILKYGGFNIEKLEYYREDTQIVCIVTEEKE